MGFENRKAKRVDVGFDIYFWPDGNANGPGTWAKAHNLSETGMAFLCDVAVPKASIIPLEFSSASKHHPVRLFAQVVYSERDAAKPRKHQIRVQFENLSGDDRMRLRQHVLLIADPKAAAATGWGKVYFPGMASTPCTYRELTSDEHSKLMREKEYISARELVYLNKFQAHLGAALGNSAPQNFKLLGSRTLKNHSVAQVELELEIGLLHLLGEVMWCNAEDKDRAESGLVVAGYQKEEALTVEKAA